MTLSEFNKLSLEEKGEFVFNKVCIWVAVREYYNHKVSLYNCGEFFAEVYYFPDQNKITKIEGIPLNDKRVDRYIDSMNKEVIN